MKKKKRGKRAAEDHNKKKKMKKEKGEKKNRIKKIKEIRAFLKNEDKVFARRQGDLKRMMEDDKELINRVTRFMSRFVLKPRRLY